MTQQFAGQTLIVIGGTSGIGKSVAQLVLHGQIQIQTQLVNLAGG